ncbi:acyl-CoA dehydrogenase family protein [Sphingobacterium arenae]|uniref:Acyl-CoA dehydrogenase family protein n=1 Tax=Sphingobacterium arenae TaxID=1280598 RepID=A0ABR7Y3J8_9SPHI|nr:acyl-CoA dehydrogenase family protein [Sphingobacterium arenae]MBD1425899.1 acyl-CoA dehydrogenase family protein [Sphingobacterium arenae]
MMLNTESRYLIKDSIRESIQRKALTPELLELIYQQNWFNLWVPKVYGGRNAKLIEGCRLLEELAYADGGFGWTVTLCAGANMFAGFIDSTLAETIFKQNKVCWGGSGKPSGRADKTGNSFIISGAWKYATGAPHLTHFTLNAWIYEDGKPVIDATGYPVYRSFFIDREDVLIHYDWDTFGLECTASHSFSISELKVSEERAFDLHPDKRVSEEPVFYYPFMTFAECTLAVNYIGMFRRFLDLFEKQLLIKASDPEWAVEKGKILFKKVDTVRHAFEEKRDRLYQLMEETWNKRAPEKEFLEEITTISRELADDVRIGTVNLFPYTGIAGAQRENELNIVFRHIFTASQHALLNIP